MFPGQAVFLAQEKEMVKVATNKHGNQFSPAVTAREILFPLPLPLLGITKRKKIKRESHKLLLPVKKFFLSIPKSWSRSRRKNCQLAEGGERRRPPDMSDDSDDHQTKDCNCGLPMVGKLILVRSVCDGSMEAGEMYFLLKVWMDLEAVPKKYR